LLLQVLLEVLNAGNLGLLMEGSQQTLPTLTTSLLPLLLQLRSARSRDVVARLARVPAVQMPPLMFPTLPKMPRHVAEVVVEVVVVLPLRATRHSRAMSSHLRVMSELSRSFHHTFVAKMTSTTLWMALMTTTAWAVKWMTARTATTKAPTLVKTSLHSFALFLGREWPLRALTRPEPPCQMPRLISAARARKKPLGDEMPQFSRQEREAGAIRTKIAADVGRGCTSTLAFVKLLFTNDILDKLVAATNKAAIEHPRVKNLSRIKKFWKPVDRKSLLMWFAIATYLGVVKVQNRKHAFSKKSLFRQPWITKHSTLVQFENVLNCLNCCDHWNLSEEEFKQRNDEYCFWQVDELIKQCNVNSQAYFRLGHRISIDEACIPWKGRHRARCYNPKKPHKFHFKKLMLNDSKTGYNYNFYYYGGKGEERPDTVSATTWPIVKLLTTTTVSPHNKNHLVAVDNWFTSSSSFAWLAHHGYSAVGTVGKTKLGCVTAKRPNGFPNAGIFKKTATRNRGSYVVHKGRLMHSDCGRTAVPYDCWVTAWQDRNPVHFLSTYEPKNAWCKRKVRVDGTWVEGQWPRPSIAHHYNQTMGGTDLHDQRCATFRSVVKSRRWQVRVLTDTFGSMLQNAFILYSQYHRKNKKYTSLNFIEELLREIAEEEPEGAPEPAKRPRKFNEHKRSYWVIGQGSDERLVGRNHWPKDARDTHARKHPQTGATLDLRRHCIWDPAGCGRTHTYCSSCMVPVCVAHFELFHTAPHHAFPAQFVKPD
jgi:hypothetical protein